MGQMYEISTNIFLASTLETPGKPLHFNNPYHFKTNGLIIRENHSRGHIHECVLEFQEKGKSNLPLVVFYTAIVASPLLQ